MLYQQQNTIKSNQEIMPEVHLLKMDSPGLASVARPGQFVMITSDDGPGRLLRRPISIHQIEGTAVSFLFAIIGKGTEWLAQRQVGDTLSWLGPLGNGFQILPESRNLLLIAGGMGIAPLCFLAAEALKTGRSVKLLAGAKTAGQICPSEFIPFGCSLIVATEDGSLGIKGMVTALLPEHLESADQVFICGPLPMYKAMAKQTVLLAKNVQVSLEVRMGCGLGFCYSCTIKTQQGLKQVCKDGPIFNFQDILWNNLG